MLAFDIRKFLYRMVPFNQPGPRTLQGGPAATVNGSFARTPAVHRLCSAAQMIGEVEDLADRLVAEGSTPPDYRVEIERVRRYTGFRLTEISQRCLVGSSEIGRDILEIDLNGFEVHWRNDLLEAQELAAPIVGQMYLRFEDSVRLVEHFCLPSSLSGGQSLTGWFGYEIAPDRLNIDDVVEVQRFLRPRRAVRSTSRSRSRLPGGAWAG